MGSKNRLLNEATRERIVRLSYEGWNQVQIAKTVKCSRKGVQTALKRFIETGSHRDRPKSGRKRKTTTRDDRHLVRISLANRRMTSSELAREFKSAVTVQISSQTIRRRLTQAGLRGCKARKKPWLSDKNKKRRLQWAKNHQNWTDDDWANVIWSDETNIEVFGTPGAVYVRRRPGEAYHPECVVPTVKYGGGSVMIWGCMGMSGTGEMFVCEGRMNSSTYIAMLSAVLEPSADKIFNGTGNTTFLFQQDNAPCHTSKASSTWLRNQGIRVLDWPAQSPDLNPIEHLWPILKKNVAKLNVKTKEELKVKIKEEWEKIPKDTWRKLIENMPRRIAAVIKAKEGITKY